MQRERLKNPQYVISLIGTAVLALFALVIAVTVVLTLKLTHENIVLGPGFYPLLLSVVMFITCLWVAYSLLSGDREGLVTKSVFDRDALSKPLMLFILLIAVVAAMPLFGFLGSMFLFSFVELTYLENQKPPLLWRIIYSLAIVGGIYWLFTWLLMSSLPGPIWL